MCYNEHGVRAMLCTDIYESAIIDENGAIYIYIEGNTLWLEPLLLHRPIKLRLCGVKEGSPLIPMLVIGTIPIILDFSNIDDNIIEYLFDKEEYSINLISLPSMEVQGTYTILMNKKYSGIWKAYWQYQAVEKQELINIITEYYLTPIRKLWRKSKYIGRCI